MCYNIKMELPEEKGMWKEKQELENTKEDTDDIFIPAKIAEPCCEEEILIHIEL